MMVTPTGVTDLLEGAILSLSPSDELSGWKSRPCRQTAMALVASLPLWNVVLETVGPRCYCHYGGRVVLGEFILLRLCVLSRHFIIIDHWSCGYIGGCFAIVMLADALLPLIQSSSWCFATRATLIMRIISCSDGCFAAFVVMFDGRLRRMLCLLLLLCLIVVFGGCFVVVLLVDTWPPACSSVACRRSRWCYHWCRFRYFELLSRVMNELHLNLLAICFVGLFFVFFHFF